MKITYVPKTFRASSLDVIDSANEIVEDYQGQGFTLTLRQLYYQFVARDLLPNTQQSYKRLGSIINDARLAGLIDWSAMEDRTRNVRALSDWDDPAEIVAACASQFRLDKWADQPWRCEVWIEKDALVGVIERACNAHQVPFFSCRGYVSQSEAWGAAMRLKTWTDAGQRVRVIHLGDHDPSGIDMTRDIGERFRVFGVRVEVVRIALNMDQVERFEPPPNPAKLTDSRASGYVAEHGYESWELDAMTPAYLDGIVRDAIQEIVDGTRWSAMLEDENEAKAALEAVADNWTAVADYARDMERDDA